MARQLGNLVNLAVLLRGRTYVFKNVHYLRGIPTVVDEETANELEQLITQVRDHDNESYDKSIFDIFRGVPMPEKDEEGVLRIPKKSKSNLAVSKNRSEIPKIRRKRKAGV